MNWEVIVGELGPVLFRYFRVGFAKEVAEDLAQDTLIRLVQAVRGNKFDTARNISLKSYALGIATRVGREHRRKFPFMEAFDDEAISDNEWQDYQDRGHDISILRRCIQELPPAQREIVLLVIDGDLTYEEISSLTGVPVNTVKSHMKRAKETLASAFTK